MNSSEGNHPDRPSISMPFRDRDSEISALVENMGKVRGKRLFLLIGMPSVGKSMFLDALPGKLSSHQVSDHRIVRVDVAEEPPEVRAAPAKLLARMFAPELLAQEWDESSFRREAAERLGGSQQPALLLLDNAETLSPLARRGLRYLLCQIIQDLLARSCDGKLTFIATSSVDIPEFNGLVPAPSFEKIVLKQFDLAVVLQALEVDCSAAGVGASKELLWAAGKVVYADTEGLPPLVNGSLQRLRSGQFQELHQLEHAGEGVLFTALVRPYIEETVLSTHALLQPLMDSFPLPSGDEQLLQNVCAAFSDLVLETSVFRLVTKTHLWHLAQTHASLKDALALIEVIGDPYDLFGALAIVEPGNELWHSPYAAVRRLCFRYRHLSVEEQVTAHTEAQAVYYSWCEGVSELDLAQFLVERLWHQAEIVRLLAPPNAKQRIQSFVDELQHLMTGNRRGTFRRRFADDLELQSTLELVSPGLSKDFVAWIGNS